MIFYGNKTDHHTSYVKEKIIVFFIVVNLNKLFQSDGQNYVLFIFVNVTYIIKTTTELFV